jgi:hypothetical protein
MTHRPTVHPKARRTPENGLTPATTRLPALAAAPEASLLRQPAQLQPAQPAQQEDPSAEADDNAADELQSVSFSHALEGMNLFPLQAKLVVGAADDPAEDEADTVAEQVMRMPSPEPQTVHPSPVVLARKIATDTRYAEDASTVVQPVLQSGGSPLDDDTRDFMESRFGHDFGAVRVHTGAQAERSAEAVNARAYTVGPDVVFGAGAYAPGTHAGKQLIAHELTHVVQQMPSLKRVQRERQETDQGADGTESAEATNDISPAEAMAQAEAEVTEAEVAQEPVEEVPAKPVALQEQAGGAAGGQGGGAAGGGGAAPAQAPTSQAGSIAEGAAEAVMEQAAKAQPAAEREDAGAIQINAVPSADASGADVADAGAATTPQAISSEAAIAAPGATEASAEASDADAAATQALTTQNETATGGGTQAESPQPEANPRPKVQRRVRIGARVGGARVGGARVGGARVVRRKAAPKSAAEDPAFQAVAQQMAGAATQAKAHEPAGAKAEQAAAAAQMPAAEKKGKARDAQAGDVTAAANAQQAQGAAAFDKAGFIAAVRAKIDQLTPKDPKEMENIEGSGAFSGARQVVQQQVQSGKQAAQGDVAAKAQEAPKTDAVPDKATTPLQPNSPGAAATVDASGAAPKPKDAGEVEVPMQAGSQQLDARMAEANITKEQLAKSNEPQFQQTLAAKEEAQTHAAATPQAFRAAEQGHITTATDQAQGQAQTGLAQMHAQRSQALAGVGQTQGAAKTADEQKRAEIGQQIDAIYTTAKGEVEGILDALDSAVDAAFSRGEAAAKNVAVTWIKQETKKYKDKRYEGAGGLLNQFGDWLTEMPAEYYEYFRRGRDLYCEKMNEVISQVADIVADHMARAKQRIAQGRAAIADFVKQQPKALRGIAQETANEALDKFNDLEQGVDAKQSEVVDALASQYQQSLQALDGELEALKAEDKGLLQKAEEAIGETWETIKQIKALLENALARAASAIGKILEDPIAFLGNLISGVSQGLAAFASNIGTHLQQGLIDWLTGALGSAGITLPKNLDAAGIFQMVMELLGLTWANIRAQIVKGLGPRGEEVMGALEQAWEVIQVVQTQGLAGLWRFVQDMVGDIKGLVMDQIKSLIADQVIKAGIDWLIGILGGPAGAFVKAAQGIVRIVTWFMNNAGRAVALVNSVLDSVSAIASGDVSGAAKFIEASLAKALPMVISFLADLLGLGGVTQKVQDIIGKVKGLVDKGVAWLVGKAKALGKKLMRVLGGGKKSEAEKSRSGDDPEKKANLNESLSAIHTKEQEFLHEGRISHESAKKVASSVQQTHSSVFTSIQVTDGGGRWNYEYVARASVGGAAKAEEGKVNAESLRAFRPKGWRPRSKTELAAIYPEAHDAGTTKLKSAKATSKEGNLYDKQLSDRRHITSFDDIKTDILEKIHGATFADAAMTLQNKGVTPSQLSNEGILDAAQAYLTEKFNDITNVWVGDSEENQERGRVMGQAKEAMEQAETPEQLREAYERYRNAAYDPEPIEYFFDKYKAIRERKEKQGA